MIQKLIDYVTSKIEDLEVTESDTGSKYLKTTGRKVRISNHLGMINKSMDFQVIVPENVPRFIVSVGFKVYIYSSLKQVGDLIVSYIFLNENIYAPYREKRDKEARALGLATKQNKEELIKVISSLKVEVNNAKNDPKFKEEISRLKTELNNAKTKLASVLAKSKDVNTLEGEIRTLKTELNNKLLFIKSSENVQTINNYKEKLANVSNEVKSLLKHNIEYKKKVKSLEKFIESKDAAIKEAAEIIEELSTNPEARQLIYSQSKGKTYYLDNFSKDAREMIEELIKEYYSK